MFACLLLSASYIKQELSYDRHHTNADRIVRMSLQFNNEPVDGRIWRNALVDEIRQLPEIEQITEMYQINTAMLSYEGKNHVIKDFYLVNSQFLNIFDLTLLKGVKDEALQHTGQVLISESFARQLFGDIDSDDFQKLPISIEGRRIRDSVFVSGIFKDMPETSHFNADIFLFLPDEIQGFRYAYLLLKKDTDIEALAQKITELIKESKIFGEELSVHALLMPLTDIHLYSHNLREMNVNGNITYIYLIFGANALLLIVVLFNLWLNASLIFAYNRRYYQLLRLYGTTSSIVFKDEMLSALLVGLLSILTGIFVATDISLSRDFFLHISLFEIVAMSALYLFFILFVSLIPAIKDISLTQFLNTNIDLKPVRFSYSNIKYMLIAQYAVVMTVVILAFGINKQMNFMKDMQVGGNEQNILVMSEQPDQVKEKYEILKSELQKHKEIEAVTACFQLSGDAIRDRADMKKEEDTDWQTFHLMVVGEDFLSFFHIPLIAGTNFSKGKYSYKEEETMLFDFWMYQKSLDYIEEYIINRKAMAMLGFSTPEEAIGQLLQMGDNGGVGYINQGVIVGITDDFNYTGLYEETNPLLILQRNMFLHCIMVRLDPKNMQQARNVFENVWNEVNPNYPADYVFMNDVFSRTYHNEMNAQNLVFIFSLLCFIFADLGLIVFIAFIIRRRTKEIGLRKVHGASIGKIIRMLNLGFIKYVALAFLVAVPVAWYVMHRWLERFAYRTPIAWWVFALAGLGVVLLSVLSVTLQSWRAATANPVEAIKIE
jgi:putative ABC transport system permease protein